MFLHDLWKNTEIFYYVLSKNTEMFLVDFSKNTQILLFSSSPSPISPFFPTFANSIFPNLERANNFLYHHPQREGQQPEKHQFADSEEQAGGHHRPVGIG